ncbi:MAG TPA: hypothetical protein VF988_06600 [Verrucomicrobiae bacterium]
MEKKNQQMELLRLQRSLKDRGQKLRSLEIRLEDLETQIAANQAAVERSKNSRLRKTA